jgi:hypothetical protein
MAQRQSPNFQRQMSEARLCALGAFVCTENADLAFWLRTGDMILEKSKIYRSSFGLDFLIGLILLWDRWETK